MWGLKGELSTFGVFILSFLPPSTGSFCKFLKIFKRKKEEKMDSMLPYHFSQDGDEGF